MQGRRFRWLGILMGGFVAAALGGGTASAAEGTVQAAAAERGYVLVDSAGVTWGFGDAAPAGSISGTPLAAPIVDAASTPTGLGHVLVGADGGVFTLGDAPFLGSLGGTPLNAPIVGVDITRTGEGYILFAADGGVFTFGDAPFRGSLGSLALNRPVVDGALNKADDGYILTAGDGGVFTFGNTSFGGSMASTPLNGPVVEIMMADDGPGYALVADDGGIFTFNGFPFLGSMGGITLNAPITDAAPSSTGDGYNLLGADGGVFGFGDAPFVGSLGGKNLPRPIIAILGLANEAPVANDDSYAGTEDTVLTVPVAEGVLADDTDDDGDPITASLVTGPTKGTLTLNSDGSFTYTPNADADGADSFTYRATDSNDASDTATATIDLAGVNDAPVAVADAPGAGEDGPGVTVTVLGNDTDIDGDTLTVSAVDTTGTSGTVTNNGTDVTYDPNGAFEALAAGQAAGDAFTYTVSDGHGGTDTATVTVTITGANDAPVLAGAEGTAVAYDTGSGSSAVTSTLTVADLDSPGLTGATVAITSGYLSGNDTLSFTDQNGITGSWSTTTGVLTLSGSSSLADYQAALRSVQFAADATTPSGTRTLSFQADDGAAPNHASNVATRGITVTHVNHSPVANDDVAGAGEDGPAITVNVPGNDTDIDGDTLTVSAVDTTGTSGTVTNNGTDVTYDPNGAFEALAAGQTAGDAFTYTVSDGHGGTDTATVTVTITGANDAPTATDDAAGAGEDGPAITVDVLGNDTDFDTSDTLTVSAVDTTGTKGTVTITNAGADVSYNPNGQLEGLDAGETSGDTFTYTASDGHGGTDTATVTVTITGANDAPTASPVTDSTNEDTPKAVTLAGTDVDAEALTFSIVTGPTHGSLGAVTGSSVTYTPDADFSGADSFTYKADDGSADSNVATVSLTVNAVNDAPVAVDDAYQATLDTALTVAAPGVLGNDTDADPGDARTAGNAGDPAHGTVTLDPDGSFSYTPDAGYLGTDTFTYDVTDGALTDTATVTINVNPPNATPTADATSAGGNEDGGAVTVTLTGHDADGNALTFTAGTATNGLVTVPGAVTCTGNPSTCTTTVTYTPNADFNGGDSFTYTVNDGTVSSAPATATITVTAVNDAPSFTTGSDPTLLEDAGAQTANGWATAISPGPANESGQTVTFTVTNNNNALFSAAPAVSSSGNLTYTPAANANGSATVSVTAVDDGGTTNPGDDDTGPTQTFTITVTAVNDVPGFTKGNDETVFEDAGAQSVSNWATAISKGPANESGQALSFTTSNTNNALFSVQPGVSPTGTLVYTPAPNAVGTATVTISLSDNGGTANGGDDTSDTQTFSVTVNAVNDAPTFTKGADETVLEDSGARTVAGWASARSAGPADESGQTVTVERVSTTNDALFSVLPAVASNGDLTYTPAADANGTATVTMRATDDGGTANGGDATGSDVAFAVTVTAVNDVPSFTKGADQTLAEDAGAQSVSGWATALSKGPANESTQALSFEVTANGNAALFSAAPAVSPTGTLTYTGAANKYGTATVTLRVKDDGGTANGGADTSATQSFVITVNAVNDPPVAAAKAFTVQANMKISLGGLLTGATDPNDVVGDATWSPSFTVGSITVGAGCTGCTVSNVNTAAGTFDFDPPAGGTGTYTLTYTVVDNGFPSPGATSAPQTITMTVNGPVIWFVDTTATGAETGRLSAPFNTLAEATTAMGSTTNQRIFVRGGNVTGNVTLPTDGWLISEAATGTNFDTVMNITPPAGTIARPAVNGTQRTLTGTVTLGTNSVVRGFDLTPASAGKGLVASSKTGLTVNQMSITSTNARAVDLASSSGVFSLTRVTATGADRGISLTSTNVSTGSFAITGTGSAGSGGVISASTALGTLATPEGGIYLNDTKNVTLKWMTISGNQANGIYGQDVTTMVLEDSTLPNNGTVETVDHTGMHFANLLGTSSMARIEVSGSREDSAKVLNTSGTATLTVSNSTFRDNNATLGANGLYIDTKNSAAMTFTSTSNTFTNNNTSGLAIFSQGTQKMNVTVTGGTYTTNGVGLDLETNGAGGMGFTVAGGTVTGCATCGVPVNVYKGSGATGTGANATAGTITGMTVTNGDSPNAPGIWVHGEGPGALRIAVTNNNVSQVLHHGILLSMGNGSSTTDATIANNTVTLPSTAGVLAGISADAGTISTDTVSVCADIRDNTVSSPTGIDIRVRNRMAGTTFRLPDYGGAATNTSSVVSYLLGRNTDAADADAQVLVSPGFTGGNPTTCTAP